MGHARLWLQTLMESGVAMMHGAGPCRMGGLTRAMSHGWAHEGVVSVHFQRRFTWPTEKFVDTTSQNEVLHLQRRGTLLEIDWSQLHSTISFIFHLNNVTTHRSSQHHMQRFLRALAGDALHLHPSCCSFLPGPALFAPFPLCSNGTTLTHNPDPQP